MRFKTAATLASTMAFLAVVGCGPAIPTEPSIPVSDTMRDACSFGDDAFIEQIIIAADVDQMAGLSEQEAVDNANQSCSDAANGDQELAGQCSDCFVTVINEVYAE